MIDIYCDEYERYEYFMGKALKEAEKAFELGEVPVGALIVKEDKIVAAAFNQRESQKNALLHAEISVINEACKTLGGWRLNGCELYVTLEPCPMCAGAIINSRISGVVYAAKDYRAGAFGSVINLNSYPLNHKTKIITGVMEKESLELLQNFFKYKRKKTPQI